jgi:predicted peroxiredoxin
MHMNSLSALPSTPVPRRQFRSPCAVILASGDEDGGTRATLALAAACAAQAMDLDTVVFLLGDGARWAYDGNAEQVHAPGFPALADLIDAFVDAGGRLLLCSACDAACAAPGARRRDVRVSGLASLLSHAAGGSTVTF